MIEATNIIKSYDKLQVLKNISLQVASEEIVCLVGASGAGKSTLLHILGTLDKPDSGKVLIDGKDAEHLLDIFNLKDRATHKPSELSGGEQQRIAIARALINNPSVVFADEPSGNLDSQNAAELHQLFVKLRDILHQTFVIVTHNPSLVDVADRVLQIKDGVII